jgi:hypothetical protein
MRARRPPASSLTSTSNHFLSSSICRRPFCLLQHLLPFVHKRSLPLPLLLVNVTGRELVWGGNYYDNGRKEN